MTTRQAAEYLHISTDQVKRLARAGTLPGRKIAGNRTGWRFDRDALRAFVTGTLPRPETPAPEHYTLPQAARRLRCSAEGLRKLALAGKIQARQEQAGLKRWLMPAAELERLIQAKRARRNKRGPKRIAP